jgi:hypothetical protein
MARKSQGPEEDEEAALSEAGLGMQGSKCSLGDVRSSV